MRRWLRPGIGIKRWLVVVFIGELLLALGGAVILRALIGNQTRIQPPNFVVDLLTLQFLPADLRPLVLLVGGLILFAYGWLRLLRALLEPYQATQEPLVELLYQRRLRARGPHIVAIGGGTGLSVLLRGLKELTSNITAVVTVADDGGSSGKLRTEMGMPPMGDIRNCIEALADAEPQMRRLLQYRFLLPQTDGAATDETTPFTGHALGNLLIAALTDITGDFEEGVREANRVLAVRGQVVPVAGKPITLHAELADGTTIEGQSRIARARPIRRVWITPTDIKPSSDALDAIATAEIVIIGPGSLYTSLLPPLLVPGMREALAKTRAPKLFVCNVATQIGETEEFGLSDHLAALSAHGLADLIDAVLVNGNFHAREPENYPAAPVKVDLPLSHSTGPAIFMRDVVDDENAHRHDPRKLAATVLELHDERFIQRRQPVSAA
ncbi:MAG: gluconeogenesis factor YvcK family protein [Candidatus Limnocylindrales bacterium]